jgi:hypothetical protein
MGGFDYGAFFLLGVDALIARIVTGPMFIKDRRDGNSELAAPDGRERSSRWKWWAIGGLSALTVPYGLVYGVGDGLGYLLGTLFHFSVSDTLSVGHAQLGCRDDAARRARPLLDRDLLRRQQDAGP